MRILFASSAERLTDNIADGEGLIAWHLMSELASRGHKVTAIADDPQFVGEPGFEVIRVLRSDSRVRWGRLDRARRVAATVERLQETQQFDVVHWLFPQAADTLLWRIRRGSVPFVAGPMDWPWPRSEVGCRPTIVRGLKDIARIPILLQIDELLVVSRQVPVPRGLRGADRRVVPFGVNIPPYESATLGDLRVLVLGRLEKSKGIFDALGAFELIAEDFPAASLVFVGDGSERAALEREVMRIGLDRQVFVAGRLPHGEVQAKINEACLLLCASHGEPFGMAILEAMAAGRPVVATRSGGPTELIEDGVNGFLVPVGDRLALADRLSRLLENSVLRRAMGDEGRETAKSRYSWQIVGELLESAYIHAVSAHRVGHQRFEIG